MRTTLLALALVAGLGCSKKDTAAPYLGAPALGTPSSLILGGPSLRNPFPMPKYAPHESWKGPHQVPGKVEFTRDGQLSVECIHEEEVDPKEAADLMDAWIRASGVAVRKSAGEPVGNKSLERTVEYETMNSIGTLVYVLEPYAKAKKLSMRVQVREWRK